MWTFITNLYLLKNLYKNHFFFMHQIHNQTYVSVNESNHCSSDVIKKNNSLIEFFYYWWWSLNNFHFIQHFDFLTHISYHTYIPHQLFSIYFSSSTKKKQELHECGKIKSPEGDFIFSHWSTTIELENYYNPNVSISNTLDANWKKKSLSILWIDANKREFYYLIWMQTFGFFIIFFVQ